MNVKDIYRKAESETETKTGFEAEAENQEQTKTTILDWKLKTGKSLKQATRVYK